MTNHALTLGLMIALSACSKSAPEAAPKAEQGAAAQGDQAQDPHAAFQDLAVTDVATLLASKHATPVDANGADTRQELGSIPGSIRLSNYASFAPNELPSDKSAPLVFYCGGQACTAAPKAAARAKASGYTQVSVMRAGIRGWVDAGQPVDRS